MEIRISYSDFTELQILSLELPFQTLSEVSHTEGKLVQHHKIFCSMNTFRVFQEWVGMRGKYQSLDNPFLSFQLLLYPIIYSERQFMLIHWTSLTVPLGRCQYNFGTLILGRKAKITGETCQCRKAFTGSFLNAHSQDEKSWNDNMVMHSSGFSFLHWKNDDFGSLESSWLMIL